MQLIVKENTIIAHYENTENIIESYLGDSTSSAGAFGDTTSEIDVMNIFIDDNIEIYNMALVDSTSSIQIPSITKIIMKPTGEYDEQGHEIYKKELKVVVPEMTNHIYEKQKVLKSFSELNITEYVSKYHLSPSHISLPMVMNENRNLDYIKADLKRYIALKRWVVEVGGTTWTDSTTLITYNVDTSRNSQDKIQTMATNAREGLRSDNGVWKFADGVFKQMTNTQMQDLGETVSEWIQGLFNLESTVATLIDNAVDLSELLAIDFDSYF